MNHPLAKLPEHPQPVNRQAALITAKTSRDNLPPMTPEQTVNRCKHLARVMEKEYPPARARWTYVLNLAAQEMGYKCFNNMCSELGIRPEESATDKSALIRRNQELQFRVLELEEAILLIESLPER